MGRIAQRYVISALEKGQDVKKPSHAGTAAVRFIRRSVADRHYQWALDYLQRGDAAAAADILAQVLETAPGFATAWFALA